MLPKLLTKLDDPYNEGDECEDLKLPFGVLCSEPLPLALVSPIVGRKMELLALARVMNGGGMIDDAGGCRCCPICEPRRAAYSGSRRDRQGDGKVNRADLFELTEECSESCDKAPAEAVERTDETGDAATVDCAVAGVIGVCCDTNLSVEGEACGFPTGS